MRLTQDPSPNEEMRDELAQAWWAARYYYADKRKQAHAERAFRAIYQNHDEVRIHHH